MEVVAFEWVLVVECLLQASCATSSLNGSLSSKSSWLRTFLDFFGFNSNLINCPVVSFLRSFFSISIYIVQSYLFKYSLFISLLYGLVFKSFFSISILYGLVFKPFWVESPYGPPYSYSYYMVLPFKPFLGRVAIWSSLFISILYCLVFKSFLGRVITFISIYI